MRRRCSAFLPLLLLACGGEATTALVRLRISDQPCGDDRPCGAAYSSEGIVAPSADEAGDGRLVLFADARTSSGALAVVEITQANGARLGVRYYELRDGEVRFRGKVESVNADVRRVPGESALIGTFSFVVSDDGGAAGGRRFVFGQIQPVDVEVDGAGGGSGDTSGGDVHVDLVWPVVIDPSSPTPDPDPEPPPPDDREEASSEAGCGDTSNDWDSGGCDGCEGSSGAGDSGCDSSGSSGCEGDTASGCDSGGSGCDGASGCSGCEGDLAANPGRDARRAVAGTWRLTWPIALVGWFKRRARRRAERSEQTE